MKIQYGIFQIDMKSKYYDDGRCKMRFREDRYLHDTEEKAIQFIPSYEDGYYIVLPIYINEENKKFKDEQDRLSRMFR